MARSVLVLAVVLSIGLSAASAQDSPRTRNADASPKEGTRRTAAAPEKAVARVRNVYNLKHVPAVDVAKSIVKLLQSERPSRADEVAVFPEPIGNFQRTVFSFHHPLPDDGAGDQGSSPVNPVLELEGRIGSTREKPGS